MTGILNFVQLNMHRALVAAVELQKRLASTPAICMVMEPCTHLNKVCHIPPNMTCVPSTTMTSRPRTAIFVPRHIPHVFLEQLSGRDCAVVLVDTPRGKLLLASIYLDYNEDVVQPWLTELMQYADSKNLPTILAFDANAHTEMYGVETNKRGEDFEEFILQNNLLLENKGNKATYHAFRQGRNNDTHIDFTLSKFLIPLVDWRVLDEEFNGSDHHTITWHLPIQPTKPPKIRPWLKAKWDVFTNEVAEYQFHMPDNFTTLKTDQLLDRWYKVVTDALDKACPKRFAKPTPTEIDWYGEQHKYLHNRAKRKYEAHRRSANPRKRKTFVKAKRAYEAACRKGKKSAWRLFVEQTPNENDMAILYRIAQKRDRRAINTLRRSDGSLTEPGTETIQELTNAHFPAATPGITSFKHKAQPKVDTSDLDKRYGDWITPELVRKSLRKFKPNKAAGPDELKPIIFKYLPNNAIAALTTIYKACIALGHTPNKWRQTKVIFLPKPGKDTYDLPKSYRPISLSNFVLKALERLVVWKMDEDLKSRPIHPKQHGFSKGKSTESAISATADYIEQQLFEGRHCLGVFLDISSAFDSISIEHIKQSLLDHNGDPELVEWYYSYLGRRYLDINLHGDTVHMTTAQGFPQGGVCSARFWLIAFDTAIRIINSEGIIGNGYADDCSALLGGTHPDNMREKMQSMLERLVRWGHSCGLRFNPQKTVVVMFTRATRTFHRLVRMEGQLIPYSDSVVYLGVTLDKEMKWQIHIQNKITKAKGLLMKMANLTHSYWGPKPKLMRWMYTGIVRPTVSYAAMVWAHQTEHQSIIDKLETLQRMAINTMVKIKRSSPNKGLEIILDITPLHLHIRKEGLAAYLRLHQQTPLQWEGIFTNLTNSISHLRYWDYVSQDIGLQDFHNETDLCNTPRPPIRFFLDESSFVDMENCQDELDCNVYTDGSKIGGRVGAGVYILRNGANIVADKFRLPDTATVYQAELAAIKEAAALLGSYQDLTSVKFYVDSQAALRTFQADTITSKLALQTLYLLNDIPAQQVVLVWTKAHIGTIGNEQADSLAKAGSLMPQALAIPAPQSSIKASIREYFDQEWMREWQRYPDARQTKLYHHTLNRQISKSLLQWNRLKLGRYIRAVTGHCNLLYHLHIIDSSISPLCRFCLQADEEFYHLANDCPPLWWERHLISAQDPDHVHDWTIDQIIAFAYLPPINEAFIKPLFEISSSNTTNVPNSTNNDNTDDPDDPEPIDSDAGRFTDSSVMDLTSETASNSSTESLLDIDS